MPNASGEIAHSLASAGAAYEMIRPSMPSSTFIRKQRAMTVYCRPDIGWESISFRMSLILYAVCPFVAHYTWAALPAR